MPGESIELSALGSLLGASVLQVDDFELMSTAAGIAPVIVLITGGATKTRDGRCPVPKFNPDQLAAGLAP